LINEFNGNAIGSQDKHRCTEPMLNGIGSRFVSTLCGTCTTGDSMLGYTKGRSTRSQTTSISKTGRNHPSVGPNKYDPGRATRANPNPFCTHFGKM